MGVASGRCGVRFLIGAALFSAAWPVDAYVARTPTELDPLIKTQPSFAVVPKLEPLEALGDQLQNRFAFESFLAAAPGSWRILADRRTGAGASIRGGGYPFIPGRGNSLTLADIEPYLSAPGAAPDRAAVEAIARDFLTQYSELLGLSVDDLRVTPGSGKVGDSHWGLFFEIYHQGVRIENTRVVLRLSAGNLIHFGVENYVRPNISTSPVIAMSAVHDILFAYVGGRQARDYDLAKPVLSVMTVATPADADYAGPIGAGIGHKLIWTTSFRRQEVLGTWTARIDAVTGEVLEFFDSDQYGAIEGGILPETSADPEIQRFMAYTGLSTGGFADGAGIYNFIGPTTVSLSGQFFHMADVCGASSLTANAPPGDIDWGTTGSPGPPPAGGDCTTPGPGGAGNTKASRSGYYHLNAIREKVNAINPNFWHSTTVTANMNILATCNANWNGFQLNFFRSGGGCGNTGEIAAIFLHEWGHGNDQSDGASGGNQGEGYADVTAAAQLHLSCMGKGFRATPCTGYGNPCIPIASGGCSGVRDLDWAKRSNNAPMTVQGTLAGCPASGTLVPPCNRETHCAGYPAGEAFWDLAVRKLPGASIDQPTSWMIAERLFFMATSTIVNYYSTCAATDNGCAMTDWFMAFLDVDDDDGNPNNGTPHAAQIFSAFKDHEMACGLSTDPQHQNSGTCPAIGQVGGVVVTPGHNRNQISWSAVAGADFYYIYRNDSSCTAGYTLIGIVDSSFTSYGDGAVANGVPYNYRVQAVVGTSDNQDSCFGALSNCSSGTPVPGPNAEYLPGSGVLTSDSGDADGFADNCESITMNFDVINNGTGNLTNVQVTGISTSSPAVTVTSSFPIALGNLTSGASTTGSFTFDLGNPGNIVAPGEPITFLLDVTATEMSGTNTDGFTIDNTELDIIPYASKLWPFETSLDGWESGGSAGWHLSSARVQPGGSTRSVHGSISQAACVNPGNANGKCDRLISPELRLQGAGPWTLKIPNYYRTETPDPGQPWDRANVHAINLDTGVETLISPSSGGLYSATAGTQYAACNQNENGWYGGPTDNWTNPANVSTFDLGAAGFGAGSRVKIVIISATDPLVTCEGFYADNITLTNIGVAEADLQLDTCGTRMVVGPASGALPSSRVRSLL